MVVAVVSVIVVVRVVAVVAVVEEIVVEETVVVVVTVVVIGAQVPHRIGQSTLNCGATHNEINGAMHNELSGSPVQLISVPVVVATVVVAAVVELPHNPHIKGHEMLNGPDTHKDFNSTAQEVASSG
jgi:hypothetical protein